jgi:hypothetical protein
LSAADGISSWVEGPLQAGLWFLNQHSAVMGFLAVPLLFCLILTVARIETVFFVHPVAGAVVPGGSYDPGALGCYIRAIFQEARLEKLRRAAVKL